MTEATIPLRQRLWNPEARLAYVLLAPAVIVLLGFMIYPIVYVFLISLFKTNKLAQLKEFVGLKNFVNQFTEKEFWQITARSLYWTAIAVAVKTLLGLVVALLLNVKYAGRRFARMLFIIPWASAVPISSILWRWVYHPEYGLLNATLKATGLWAHPPTWLGLPLPAFTACIWVDIWIGIPFMALVFLAGMQAISEDLYESAYLDGVNAFQKFFFITLPGIRHLVLIATLLSCLWTFNDFNTIYILTRGGPAGATDILITKLYRNAFEFLKFSPAAVMAVVTFFILTGLSIALRADLLPPGAGIMKWRNRGKPLAVLLTVILLAVLLFPFFVMLSSMLKSTEGGVHQPAVLDPQELEVLQPGPALDGVRIRHLLQVQRDHLRGHHDPEHPAHRAGRLRGGPPALRGARDDPVPVPGDPDVLAGDRGHLPVQDRGRPEAAGHLPFADPGQRGVHDRLHHLDDERLLPLHPQGDRGGGADRRLHASADHHPDHAARSPSPGW